MYSAYIKAYKVHFRFVNFLNATFEIFNKLLDFCVRVLAVYDIKWNGKF